MCFCVYLLCDVKIGFEESIKDPFMLMFFTSVGLGADFASLKKGGSSLRLFSICVILLLVTQNAVGVGVMSAMGENPLLGLLAGSITLSGGHGTGGAWSTVLALSHITLRDKRDSYRLAASYGLIAGGLLGGPMAQFLINKYNLKSTDAKQIWAIQAKRCFSRAR